MIIALAGRRVDPTDATPARFSPEQAAPVLDRVRSLLEDLEATTLVGSGACGADLLAMQAAGGLGLRRRMVLPFEPARFREKSVVDRPGDWGPLFDQVTSELATSGDLIVLGEREDSAAYVATNLAILDEALRLARGTRPDREAGVIAVVVWDGQERGPGDMTADFARQACARGLTVTEVSTRADDPDDPNPTRS